MKAEKFLAIFIPLHDLAISALGPILDVIIWRL